MQGNKSGIKLVDWEDNNHAAKQELAMDEAMKLQGLKQMNDMCEWLEMESSVSFDWYKWVDGYEECPVEDYHQLEGDHKALFVQMINHCPNFDACLSAWKQYTLLIKSEAVEPLLYGVDSAVLHIDSIEPNGNVYMACDYNSRKATVEINVSKHTRISGPTDILTLANDDTLNGMAVWVDGVLDFMWGYPNLGLNGYMPATEIPA